MLEKLLIIPALATFLTIGGFALNEQIYLNKTKVQIATLEDRRVYEKNNKDLFCYAVGIGVLTSLIAYCARKEQIKNTKNN